MDVQLKKKISGRLGLHLPGDVVTIPDAQANAWIAQGLAVAVTPAPAPAPAPPSGGA